MIFWSHNPADGSLLQQFNGWTSGKLEQTLEKMDLAQTHWSATNIERRVEKIKSLGQVLRKQTDNTANLITLEMGKLSAEARAETEKCAWLCDYYAEHAASMLQNRHLPSDAVTSYVAMQSLGITLAIMPWNFPVWQVMRCAIPALLAGNGCLLKHASNVPQCALHLEQLLREAGFPEHLFTTALIDAELALKAISSPHINTVSFTGSEAAGRQVAAECGRQLKKSVLELGGSDPFVVLADADLDHAVPQAIIGRFLNAGQSCIAAKRFIVLDEIADEFVSRFTEAAARLIPGPPQVANTTLAPMAREDLRHTLHRQVKASIDSGAQLLLGGEIPTGPGWYYPATVLDRVSPGMPAFDEEIFGPAACIIRARNDAEALALANRSHYGLGSSVWTRDRQKADFFIEKLQAGMTFVNGFVKSDPRLPFGGIKNSGYGRELGHFGLQEFVNVKTVWQHW